MTLSYTSVRVEEVNQITTMSEIVKPIEVNGIEFYVSKDGKQIGLSQVGLSRLVGINEAPLRRILAEIVSHLDRPSQSRDNEVVALSAASQYILSALGNTPSVRPYLDITSSNQAKVVNAVFVSVMVEYYAYEAKNKTEIALFSFRKFARTGIETWIKEVTNFVETSDTSALLASMASTLNLLASDVAEMKAELLGTEGYRAARVTLPGLKEWMESLDTQEFKQLQLPTSEAEELFTITEWANIAQNGLVLSKSNKHALANLVSATYKTMALEMPQKVTRYNDKGYKLQPVQAYPRRHFILLNMCYSKLVAAN